jgi:hypothetical protein
LLRSIIPCLVWAALPAQGLLRVAAEPPAALDLRADAAADWLPRDARDPAQAEASRRAWRERVAPLRAAGAVRILLPAGPDRLPLLLAAAQALRAQDPEAVLYLGFDPRAEPIWDETAWGAVQGGALLPADLGPDPARWRDRLMAAQNQFPGRPWHLWLPADPGPRLGELLGDGARVVVPAGGPGAALAARVPPEGGDLEGGFGDLTVRRPEGTPPLRWVFRDGAWMPAAMPKGGQEVRVTAQAAYDVGALLARMRAAQLADQHRVRTWSGRLALDLHLQGEQGPGTDLGFRFRTFEAAGEPEEVLQEQVLVNGVKANLGPGLQLPIVESRIALAPPVALVLTERYRYRDGGSGGPGRRWIGFEPVDPDPLQPSGRLLVQEATGRVVEEHRERSGLPGVIKSERVALTYGPAGPGGWRVLKAEAVERWLLGGRSTQARRVLAYSDLRADEPGFETDRQAARASDGTMMRQTVDGTRYFNKQKDGSRRVEARPRSSGRGLGVVVLADPSLRTPVIPLGGLAYFNFNALDRGIQVNLLTALVYNVGQVTVPLGRGFDLSADSTSMFLNTTERPIVRGRLQDRDGVGRRFATLNLTLGHDLGWDLRLDGSLRLQQDRFAQAPESTYRTAGFVLPPSGLTREWRGQLSWQRAGFQLAGYYGEGRRPDGIYGAPGALRAVPDQGRFSRWGGAAGYDRPLGSGAWLHGEAGRAGGAGFDRFKSLSVGGLGGDVRIAGLRTNAVSADRLDYAKLGVVLPSSPGLRLSLSLDHARFRNLDDRETRRFTGLGLAGDLPGFGWFTTVRLDLGAGLLSDMPGVRAVNGFVALLRVF